MHRASLSRAQVNHVHLQYRLPFLEGGGKSLCKANMILQLNCQKAGRQAGFLAFLPNVTEQEDDLLAVMGVLLLGCGSESSLHSLFLHLAAWCKGTQLPTGLLTSLSPQQVELHLGRS